MKLYLSHSSSFDYQTELYEPLKRAFADSHDIFFPHDPKNEGRHSKDVIVGCDVVIAEISFPSTGQGIELGWADAAGVSIICFYKYGANPSGAIRHVTKAFFSYSTTDKLISELTKYLE